MHSPQKILDLSVGACTGGCPARLRRAPFASACMHWNHVVLHAHFRTTEPESHHFSRHNCIHGHPSTHRCPCSVDLCHPCACASHVRKLYCWTSRLLRLTWPSFFLQHIYRNPSKLGAPSSGYLPPPLAVAQHGRHATVVFGKFATHLQKSIAVQALISVLYSWSRLYAYIGR
jgi:hypothetical protein